MRLFNFFIQMMYWLQAFASPFLVSAVISFIIYTKNEKNKIIAIAVLFIGALAGILLPSISERNTVSALSFRGFMDLAD